MAQPTFHRRRIASFGTTMTDATQAMLERWDFAGRQEPFDVAGEFSRLTLEIAGKTLFSTDLTREARTVGESFGQVNEEFTVLNVKPFGTIMARLPIFAGSRRLQAGIRVLDEVVARIINERRQDNQQHDDLLAMLMEARDEETGEGMNDKLLRDQVMTLMLAGHETTSVALSWIFHLLSTHEPVLEQLLAEVDEVLGGGVPTMEDVRDLVYTRMVIDEALRLYPPAYAMARWANEADVVGGYDVGPNSAITLVSYLTHRHPDFWPEPEKFDPQRFSAENVAGRPRFAYVPFGGGPRQCIGNSFALTEATLLLATIAQRYRPEPVPGHKPELEPLITLRPKSGMPLYMLPRQLEKVSL
jgi:cytochrome P450